MIIRDDVHGTVEFDDLEERVIDSGRFQKLRRIKQMSFTNLVYPGANHSRFEHSLGTAHLSYTIARKLGIDEDDARKVKLYGLLHDIGHGAFSHEGEDVLSRYTGGHEAIGRKKIISGEIADIIRENYDPKEIADIERSKYGSIITSDLGSDRMDYLKRDALNTGVAYGIIDIDRVVHTLTMEKDELCISKGGLEAAEYVLIARFMMFSAVYLHKTVRIATAMLYRGIEGTIKDGTVKPQEFADMDDEEALLAMRSSKSGKRYAEALLKRRLYKEVCSLPKDGWNLKKAAEISASISEKTGGDIIIDYPRGFFKPISLKVKTDEGLKQITSLSTLVRSLKESEEDRLRVLVLADEQTRDKSGEKIRKMATDP
jgi:HD superfamily phosphohydrolase